MLKALTSLCVCAWPIDYQICLQEIRSDDILQSVEQKVGFKIESDKKIPNRGVLHFFLGKNVNITLAGWPSG